MFQKMKQSIHDRSGAFLNYHHLRYFWAVAKEGGLRKASEWLRVSQPSISTQIGLLEEALGEKLFRLSGRSLKLTEFGHWVFGYAEEIFTLGAELQRANRQAPGSRVLRFQAGVVDSFPKPLCHEILRPLFDHQPPVQLVCVEGKLEELLAQLLNHRLDMVLSDEPASPGLTGGVFNHPLGSSPLSFCAVPALAKRLGKRFPSNLDGAPAVLPTHNCSLRRDLERWFGMAGVRPRVVAELEDAALMKIVATGGTGFIPLPSAVLAEAVERYGFVQIGSTTEVVIRWYAITVERRYTHPLIQTLTAALGQTAGKGLV